MSQPRVLYCGDTSLDGAAAYLAGLMSNWGWDFIYVASDRQLAVVDIPQNCSLFVFSDYPAKQIDIALQTQIVEMVRNGAGLLMIGGWESYHGLGGNWNGTPIAAVLPVDIADHDDRRNCDQPVFARPTSTLHPITDGLPWSERPPLIGGFNAFTPKSDSQTLLQAVRFEARFDGDIVQLRKPSTTPLLVTGTHGSGRTVALATDVAPHWIGPMVDWGTERVSACAAGAGEIEAGNLYAAFFHSLLSWASQLTINEH
ncbi:MAG: hypothetical protein HQ518_14785 [Rhodopirellula sp.]|nr:hypothetical protein [Rhodopirellula sp.]